MRLSPHFTLMEFISPRDRAKPSDAVVNNLIHLCLKVLEPLRKKKEAPLNITSGWRSLLYNLRVGGAINGQHPRGTAADVESGTFEEQMQMIALASQIPEVGGLGFYPGAGFLHVDIRRRRRGKIITWMRDARGKYVAIPPHIRQKLADLGAKDLL